MTFAPFSLISLIASKVVEGSTQALAFSINSTEKFFTPSRTVARSQ
jgi:hypothetical protein